MSETPLYLVTGANGHIASALVKRLVDDGAHVRATVRREAAGQDLRQTLSPHAKGSLEIALVGDITAPGAFKDALQGATHVFHMASPIPGEGKTDAKRDLLDPAVDGTLTLLRDAHATTSVRKVVLTASVVSIWDLSRANQGGSYTESDWNPVTYDQAIALGAQLASSSVADRALLSMQVYAASKTLAERAAWDFVTEHKPSYAFTTVHPAFVIGKPTIKNAGLSGSNGIFWNILASRPIQQTTAACVDLGDTVEGHIKAMEKEQANHRRFILVGDEPLTAQMTKWAKAHGGSKLPFDDVDLPDDAEEIENKVTRFDVSAAESVLGIKFKPLQQTVEEFVDWVTENDGELLTRS